MKTAQKERDRENKDGHTQHLSGVGLKQTSQRTSLQSAGCVNFLFTVALFALFFLEEKLWFRRGTAGINELCNYIQYESSSSQKYFGLLNSKCTFLSECFKQCLFCRCSEASLESNQSAVSFVEIYRAGIPSNLRKGSSFHFLIFYL